jgi:hypothetical protein
MRIIILALAFLPATAIARDGDEAPVSKAQPMAQCQAATRQFADRSAEPARNIGPRTLAQEPLANQYHPVLRRENGCDVPVTIREDVGRQQR